MLSELFDRGEGFVAQGLTFAISRTRSSPYLAMRPGRREVELHGRRQLEPTVVFGFVGIEVVEHDADGGVEPSNSNSSVGYNRPLQSLRVDTVALTLLSSHQLDDVSHAMVLLVNPGQFTEYFSLLLVEGTGCVNDRKSQSRAHL